MKGDDIAERLLGLAAGILRLINGLPDTVAGRHITRQLIRSGTSCGANYEEARSAESRADFAHKVSLAGKEVRESHYWLRLIFKAHMSQEQDLADLCRESGELVAILIASARTAREPR